MNSVFMIRGILGVLVILGLLLILKVYRAMIRERRIARYSLNMDSLEELSILDRIFERYHHFISKFQNNKTLKKQASKYDKYLMVGEEKNAINFILNKLVISICFVLLIVISYAIQGKVVHFFSFLFCLIIGYYIYDVYLIIYTKRRRNKIKNEMLRAVIIMNNAFKAGKSTLQAVEIASRDLPKPIGIEFQKIYQDMSYGLSADVAFGRFAKRVNLEEATYISSSLTILNKTGGNIVMVFSSIERTLFDKKKLESDLKNSTAASNLVVKVLMVIPILFVLVIYVVSPTYFEPLFESTLGYCVLLVIGLMFTCYLYLLNKIMKVKV